jgi:hypothetical protein
MRSGAVLAAELLHTAHEGATMLRYFLPCAVLTIGLTVPAQAQVKLEWKFKEGDTFYIENVTKTKESIGIRGMANEYEKTTTGVARYKVVKTTADGAVLEMQFVSVKSDGNDPLPALAGTFTDELKEVTFRITLSATGQVSKIEGFDDFFKKFAGDDKAVAKDLRSMGLEELYTQGITQAFGFLPAKAVSKGDKWKLTGTLPLPQVGSFKTETEYTYQGPGDNGEQITFVEKYTYELPKAMDGALLKITKGDTKVEPSKGTITFDVASWRLVRLERPFKFKGTFTADGKGKELTFEVEQESTVIIRLFKENPVK